MRLTFLSFLAFFCFETLLTAQPGNDDCSGLEDLGAAPACTNTIYTNVDATASDIGPQVDLIREHESRLGRPRVAVLVTHDYDFAMNRMLELTANGDINQFEHYFGAGLNYVGPFHGRDEDVLGLAIAMAVNGDPFKDDSGATADGEINVELTYNAPIFPWLTVQPDAQYIINPGGMGDLDNAFVVGIRFEITPLNFGQ